MDDDIAAILGAAAVAQQGGDYRAAASHLEKVLTIQPDNPQALNSLGMIALGQQDFEAAAAYFVKATEADTASPVLWINLATAYRRAGDAEGERHALQQALIIDQGHLTANLRLAELYEHLGEKGDAMRRWAVVLGIAQSIPDPSPAIGDLIAMAGDNMARHSQALGAVLDSGLEDIRTNLVQGELRRFDACVDAMLGRRKVYFNDCAGAHFPFLPADEFFDPSHFPWLTELEAQTDIISQEFRNLWQQPESFQPYVAMDEGTPRNEWSDLDHSLDWSAYFLWRHGVRNDEACKKCPQTAKAVERLPMCQIPGRSPTVFFSILKPHTRLPAHTGVTNVRGIVHLPLIIPESCGFRVGGETRQWRTGEAFVFDDTINHEAWNDSDQPRAILIFDIWNPHLTETEKGLIQKLFNISAASSYAQASTVD